MTTNKGKEPEIHDIYISVSQIAILIRECPYGSLIDMIKQLWKKYDINDYKQKIKTFEKKKNIKIETLDQWDKLENLSYKLNCPNIKNITTSLMSTSTKKELEEQQLQIINKIQNIQLKETNNLSQIELENDKKVLIKLFTSFTNRGFGQKHEETVINKYQNITNTVVFDKQRVVIGRIKKATDTHPFNWFIKGKIDGLCKKSNSETILVEIKNRTKNLFKILKDYEKPQIQCYMKLLGLEKAHLVEHIKGDIKGDIKGEQIEEETNIIPVEFENEYWTKILEKLKRFINFFYDFLKDTKMQEIVLINGSYDEDAENDLRKKLEDYLN
jgi:hypothetical protein